MFDNIYIRYIIVVITTLEVVVKVQNPSEHDWIYGQIER